MIKFALFGAGRIGKIHAENVVNHPNAQLVGLHDPFKENADQLSQKLGSPQMSPDEIFASKEVDAILVCSATDTHAELIEKAVANGKHIFCEKPIDLSLERVLQVIKNVEGGSSKTMVAFNRRFDPNFALLKQRLQSGEIGKIEMVSIISKDPGPPPVEYIKVSGGLFRDMTIHDFDMARFLLGEEIVAVSAQASCLVNPEIGKAGDVDTAIISMSTASGKLAQISNSRRASFGYDQRLEIHGSQGMLTAQNVNESTVSSHTAEGISHAKPLHFFLERYDQAYKDEIDGFVRKLEGESIDLPEMFDGLQAIRIAEAAILSVSSGKTVSLASIMG